MQLLDDYLTLVRECDKRWGAPPETDLMRSVLGAASEVGELATLLRRALSRGGTLESLKTEADPLDILDESGDVIFNAVRTLDAVGFTLADALKASRIKLESRAEAGKDKDRERRLLENAFDTRRERDS